MGKNIVERAVSPYNAANRAIQHETYGLFAPAANVNKPGMAGFDPRYFAVREQIVELSQAFLRTIQPIIREVPEQGIDNILELNCIYMNVSARVVDTISADGELEYINVTGSLMVFGTETAQTQVLFAEGRIWVREVTLIDDELVIDEFMPIGSDETVNERLAEMENEITECVSLIEDITDILISIPTIIREVPEQGINGMLERNSLYVDVFARVKTSTYDSHGNYSPVTTDMLGSLMVFGTESIQTQVLFASGCIWTRKIKQENGAVVVGTFEPIASKDKVELLEARVADLNTTVYDEPHYIPEVFDTVSDQVFGKTGTYRGYYLTFGKDYLCKIPDDEPIPTEFDMQVEVAATISGPEWLVIINDPENSSGTNRFCSFRIESFENSVVTYWLNGRKYEVVYQYAPGISSTTAILWCNYEVLTEEDGLPTFEYVYPLRNRIKALEKSVSLVETDIENIKIAVGRVIIATEQLDKRMDALDVELLQSFDAVDKQIINVNARVDSVEESLTQGLSNVGAEIERVDEKADTNAEDIEGLRTENANIRGDISELRNVVNVTSQFLTETMEDVDKIKNTKLYRHNVFLYYHHIAPNLYTAGDGMIQASFTLINNDKDSYTFEHNTGSNPSLQTMSLDSAWQLTRLYRAIALSTNKNDEEMGRPCSGICLVARTISGSRVVITCPNILVVTNYTGSDTAGWQKNIKVVCYSTDASKFGGADLSIASGHPMFELNGNEILWPTKEEFETNEYDSYSSYFCQHTVYCIDRVEELINYMDN